MHSNEIGHFCSDEQNMDKVLFAVILFEVVNDHNKHRLSQSIIPTTHIGPQAQKV